MRQTLTPRTRSLLDIQGFDTVDVQELARVVPWLRLAFGLCALLGGMLTFVALLVSTTDICIPSMIYRSIFRLAACPRRHQGVMPGPTVRACFVRTNLWE
jgi:hypothetical protein